MARSFTSNSHRKLCLPTFLTTCILLIFGGATLFAKVVVLWQDGFPTVASEPISRATLMQALSGDDPVFIGIEGLRDPAALAETNLLILPYGSAFPTEDWSAIQGYLRNGGNLLTLGGQPFRVPVTQSNGKFEPARPQDTYSRAMGVRNTYEVPVSSLAKFAWKDGYGFLQGGAVQGRRFFALEGRLDGLGYMVAPDGTKVAAPVVVADRIGGSRGESSGEPSRVVMLDFEPKAGYWASSEGTALVRQAAGYAQQGAVDFRIEMRLSAIRPDELPQIQIHIENSHPEKLGLAPAADAKVEILSGSKVIDTTDVTCPGSSVDVDVPFRRTLAPGFYTVRAIYSYGNKPREFYRNGFWVSDGKQLDSGPALGVKGDFLTRNGVPFFPFGTNYFTTEENGWDFSGPRNAAVWDHDFADMERHGVTFVRTGVWMPNGRFVEPSTGEVNERFLRNLEAYLLSAQRHKMVIDFNFYSAAPRTGAGGPARAGVPAPPPNPYTNSAVVRAEQKYVLSIVKRFKDVPWLCYDLINEPSFSNPRMVYRGNVPNGDPTEVAAWRKWLRQRYGAIAVLASAWSVPPEELGSFARVPLPIVADLAFSRYGNARHVRAVDYNLFAQDAFTGWAHGMVMAIRGTGSKQLINIGQDEGGVTDRVLNQFFATSGVSFTVNHTYWRDDALLWDSVVAKRPGMPNFTGETGYQPVWAPDGTWRYDELTGYLLEQRKWALGFAAGSSGAIQWDWAREVDFGMERSDGSAKSWEAMMRNMGQFAKDAAPYATALIQPEVALVLPQSFQLSDMNATALQAQQAAVRALYHYARGEAYAVGEYQIDRLGSPKLIILPSAYTLTASAWDAIVGKVKEGSTLLVSGPFDEDAHFHPTGRQDAAGLPYTDVPLTIRDHQVEWPGGELTLTYGGTATTYLSRALLPGGKDWSETTLGKGKILFSALPLELNENLQAVGEVYRYALKEAGVSPEYSTDIRDAGILICPTKFPHATLYVLTSESNQKAVSFTDRRSGKNFSAALTPGSSALLLIGDDGKVLASYNWKRS